MKRFFNVTKNLLIVVVTICYLLFVPLASVLMLHKNKNNISEINDKYFIVIDNKLINDNYKKNTLVVINKVNINNLNEEQELFVYYDKNIEITNIKEINNEGSKTFITIDNNKKIDENNILGVVENKYSNLGLFVKFIETKLGFIIFMILPCVVMFIYGVVLLFFAIKKKKNKKTIKREIIIDENKKIIDILEEKIFDNINHNENVVNNIEEQEEFKNNKIEDLIDEIGALRKEYDKQNTFTQEIPILTEKEIVETKPKEIVETKQKKIIKNNNIKVQKTTKKQPNNKVSKQKNTKQQTNSKKQMNKKIKEVTKTNRNKQNKKKQTVKKNTK